jgi:predicted RNase H-like nuclease
LTLPLRAWVSGTLIAGSFASRVPEQLAHLTIFLAALEAAGRRYALGADGPDGVTVTLAASADERWEVAFRTDGSVRLRRFRSGGAGDEADPEGLLRELGLAEIRTTPEPEPRRPRVAGVDLAKGGLAVAVLEGDRVVEAYRCETFADALLVDAEVVAVDVPIGIPEDGVRPADEAARRFVGPRASSVFSTPVRSVLEAATYADARETATARTGKSLSAQSYALGRRILELDAYAHGDERVIEVHPEVSFRELARRPLQSKHTSHGLAERRALLEEAGIELPRAAPRLAEPDLLDATVAAWSAARYARGEALPLPPGQAERIGAIWR